jgi:hypothetical protein
MGCSRSFGVLRSALSILSGAHSGGVDGGEALIVSWGGKWDCAFGEGDGMGGRSLLEGGRGAIGRGPRRVRVFCVSRSGFAIVGVVKIDGGTAQRGPGKRASGSDLRVWMQTNERKGTGMATMTTRYETDGNPNIL